MAYNLKFSVTKDLPTKLESLSSTEVQDYILNCGKELENFDLKADEILKICSLENKTLCEYLSERFPNFHLNDYYSYPKIEGDTADVYLIDTKTNTELRVVSFQLLDFEKTQKLHEKLEKMGKKLQNNSIIPIINKNEEQSNINYSEEEKKYLIFLDCGEYNKNFAKESQKRSNNGEFFEIIKELPKRDVDLGVDEAYKLLGL